MGTELTRKTRKSPDADAAGRHGAAASVELDPTELVAVAEEIRREFPLVLDRSGLVLYDVDPHRLQAQWQLSVSDLAQAKNAFPARGSSARLLLRLRRLLPNGTSEDVASLSRNAGAVGPQGLALFEVPGGDAAYQAELGLASEDGGWLLLERSNRFQPARPVRVPVGPHVVGQDAVARVHLEPREQGGDALAEAGPIEGRITHRGVSGGSVAGQSVAVHESGVEPALAAVGGPLDPVFPLPIQVRPLSPMPPSQRKGPFAWEDATLEISAEHPPNLQAPFGPAADAGDASWVDLPPPLLPSAQPSEGDDRFYDPRGALSSRELSGGRTSSAQLELHAELRIWGRAAPGSVIDVFGMKVHVGSDGTFSLFRSLDDSALLFQALERIDPSTEGRGNE